MAETASKEKIIKAAWLLLASADVDQFSMRKLAKKVGITASTLYWHFSSKEAIFAELVDEVCGHALNAFKVEPSWQQQLIQDGVIFARTLRQYTSSAELLFITPPVTAHFLQINEHFLKSVDDLALSDPEKFMMINLYLNFILTFERDRQLRHQNPPRYQTAVGDKTRRLAATTPVLGRIYKQGIFDQMDKNGTLEWSLTTLVKGFEARQHEISN